jgi:hypothetical protein
VTDIEKRTRTEDKPKLGQTVLEDLRRGDFQVTMKRDWGDVIRFYLDEEDLLAREKMGPFKKWLFSSWWLLKSMFFKLTPARRLILLISIALLLSGLDSADGYIVLSFIGLLLILILELKDKLLAQDELQSGRAVQIALMPDRSPQFEGWDIWLYAEPANDVGGDLVDYQHIGDDRLGLALGDVAGKGLPAALFMAKLQATIRAVAPSHESLSDLAAEINWIFWRDKLPNRFASLLYAEVEEGTGRMRLFNAGHLPPMYMNKSRVSQLASPGDTAIGLVKDAAFHERDLEFAPGDTMVVYSDGVSEARDENGVFFGQKRLLEVLAQTRGQPAGIVGSAILGSIDSFVGNARTFDDLSIIVIRRVEA